MTFRFHGGNNGDYSTVGFPGLVGPLAAVAKGRFAIAINYVRHAEESTLGAIVRRVLAGYWPVAFAVRQALDDAPTFDAAVRHLTKAPLLAPVLLTLAGTKPGEGVVIERTTEDGVVRRMDDTAPVCVTNHYVSEDLIDSNEGIEEIDTVERLDALERGIAANVVHDAQAALKLLSRKSLMSEITAHQVVARPRDGMFVVRVPGQKSVTADLG